MCAILSGMVLIKDHLLLIEMSSPFSGSLSDGPLPYVRQHITVGARCSSMVRAFAHGAMGRRIDPSL